MPPQALPNLPPMTLMKLWGDLIEARHGCHGYGGHVAELYAYRFGGWSPGHSPDEHQQRRAAQNLHLLLTIFGEEYGDTRITLDGRPFGNWMKQAAYDHRVHVRITGKA